MLFMAVDALGGSVSSGGGQIHRDGQNPWFLENTKVVHYCVDVDEANFGVIASEASAEIKAGLNEWLAALAAAGDDYYKKGELEPYGQLRLGTQTFQEHNCSEPVDLDLRFQLGRLTSEQERLFNNPKEIVGIAFRTDYSKETLKGKGFIYLSPVSGPLAPHHPSMHPTAWKSHQNFALKSVLRHEIGHIFGIDHQPNSVMDNNWPEFFVSKTLLDLPESMLAFYKRKINVLRLFGLKEDWLIEGCGPRNPVFSYELFHKKTPEDEVNDCGRVTFQGSHLKIEFRDATQTQYETIGTATLDHGHTNSVTAVIVYFTSEQQVFSKIPEEARRFGRLVGHSKNYNQKWSGTLKIQSTGELLPLLIDSDANRTSAAVIKGGHFNPDLFFLE